MPFRCFGSEVVIVQVQCLPTDPDSYSSLSSQPNSLLTTQVTFSGYRRDNESWIVRHPIKGVRWRSWCCVWIWWLQRASCYSIVISTFEQSRQKYAAVWWRDIFLSLSHIKHVWWSFLPLNVLTRPREVPIEAINSRFFQSSSRKIIGICMAKDDNPSLFTPGFMVICVQCACTVAPSIWYTICAGRMY